MDLLHAAWEIERIEMSAARDFVLAHHYARLTPSTTVVAYGLFLEFEGGRKLMGVSIWGYGVRPRHTIEKWFPGLEVTEYLELNRLCLLDEMPRNSESKFLSVIADRIKADFPRVKILLSWADGLRGKPGFVYQACSWLYGGFINSEFYTNQRGEVIHPRLLITRYGSRGKAIQKALDLNHYFGKQFMYCRFICSKTEKKNLLRASPFSWGNDYPKGDAITFAVSRAGGDRQKLDATPFLQGRSADASAVLGVMQ